MRVTVDSDSCSNTCGRMYVGGQTTMYYYARLMMNCWNLVLLTISSSSTLCIEIVFQKKQYFQAILEWNI